MLSCLHMKRKPKIVRRLPEAAAHRGDFETCPSCEFKQDWEKWTHDTHLVLDEVYGKHGSVAVVSECPKCFELSWVHENFYNVTSGGAKESQYSKEWQAAAAAEEQRRHLAAVRILATSQCVRCTHLLKLDVNTHAWKQCTLGRGKSNNCSGPMETNCPHFKSI